MFASAGGIPGRILAMVARMDAEMVQVSFEPAGARVWVKPETTIHAAAEAAGVEIMLGCTEGMCGTDPVQILAGRDGLSPAAEHEKGTLERMGLGAEFRLSCSAKLQHGTVQVKTDAF